MKSTVLRLLLFLLPLLLAIRFSAAAQGNQQRSLKYEKRVTAGIAQIPGETIQCYYADNLLIVNKLKPDEFDKAAVYNMQGAVVLRQKITAATIRMDATGLEEGVYLLVLSSSHSFREKSLKVVVRK
jgi:hypothetical protein